MFTDRRECLMKHRKWIYCQPPYAYDIACDRMIE